MTDETSQDTTAKPPKSTAKQPSKDDTPTACPVCQRPLNADQYCQRCGYQHQ